MSKNKSSKTAPRNSLVVPMNKRNKTQVFADRREPRGGNKNEQKELLDIYEDDCIVSYEQTKLDLQEVENKIAIKLGLTENIRATLVELDRRKYLSENELVVRWRSLFSELIDWDMENERDT